MRQHVLQLIRLILDNKDGDKEFVESLRGHPNFREITSLTGEDVLKNLNVGDIVLLMADRITERGD